MLVIMDDITETGDKLVAVHKNPQVIHAAQKGNNIVQEILMQGLDVDSMIITNEDKFAKWMLP